MSEKESKRISVLEKLINGELTNREAGERLGLKIRQVQRLKVKYEKDGIKGIIHKNRGRESNRKMKQEKKEKIENLLKEKYPDFGPQLAKEYLAQRHDIDVSKETIRQIQINKGLWKPRKKKVVSYRAWREPRASIGELIQFDGSYEYWLEDRFEKCCLLCGIDDATGHIMKAMLVKGNESIENVFNFWNIYIKEYGCPESIYVDRFSTYKQNTPTPKEDIKTQFGRVMESINIEMIFAHSPQAKGRIERVFETLQDRLIKAMRIDGINNLEEGNKYISEIFIPFFNEKFGRDAKNTLNKHIPLNSDDTLNEIFSVEYIRVLANDWTINFMNMILQIEKKQKIFLKPTEKILVYQLLNGEIILKSPKDITKKLEYHKIDQRIKVEKIKQRKEKEKRVVPDSHPWKHSDPYYYHRG